jgi:hypothetical protein
MSLKTPEPNVIRQLKEWEEYWEALDGGKGRYQEALWSYDGERGPQKWRPDGVGIPSHLILMRVLD